MLDRGILRYRYDVLNRIARSYVGAIDHLYVFIHDNVCDHSVRLTTDYLSHVSIDVKGLPARSTDFNLNETIYQMEAHPLTLRDITQGIILEGTYPSSSIHPERDS